MKSSYDYIIIGGGSAGSVLAGRLSEDPDQQVCLLEAGGDGNSPFINIPAGAVAMLPTKLNNWAFETVPQPGLNGRKGYQPRGKALGGSSATNAMVYIRGHASDYDRWAAEGADGWAYQDVLPYFRLAEHNERIRNEFHGQGGPLNVSDLRSDNPIQQMYLQAAREAGFRITDDFNGADQEGVGIYQVTQRHGERLSAARAYLLPHIGLRDNLHVHTHAMTQRVVFQGKRAVGVEVEINGQQHTLLARKEVLLCAGAFQSPQLLMLSGVGDSMDLMPHGIGVLHELKGVGKNLHDHPDFIFGYSSKSLDTLGVSLKGTGRMMREISRFRQQRRGMLTSNFAEGGGFLKTNPNLVAPDVQLHFVVALVDDHARNFHLGHGFSCHVCLLRPTSRGQLQLATNKAADAPLIDIGFYKDPQDLETMVEGFKLTQRLMQAPALAQLADRDLFTSHVKSDEDIREVLRNRTDTVYHPVGTCKMGKDELSVVDSQFRVHGLEGLRVVDGSTIPSLVGGNTNAPIIMMAERAVDFIRGVSRVSNAASSLANHSIENTQGNAQLSATQSTETLA